MTSPFDRFGPPPADGALRPGKAALFSDVGGGGVRLVCARCRARTRPTLGDVVRGVPWFVLPVPGGPVRGRCPACRHRAWLRVTAGGRSSSDG